MSETFSFFWYGPFSQWYPSSFVVKGITYCNAEQYMMWFKDQVFGGKLERDILDETDPKKTKALGRTVEGFNRDTWDAVAKHGVFVGNMAKFTQNPELMAQLLATTGTLVEASPFDRIWGIGLDESNPLALDRKTWRGTNWLGEVLTDVRESIIRGRQEKMTQEDHGVKVDHVRKVLMQDLGLSRESLRLTVKDTITDLVKAAVDAHCTTGHLQTMVSLEVDRQVKLMGFGSATLKNTIADIVGTQVRNQIMQKLEIKVNVEGSLTDSKVNG